jgi:hypothetical protein
MAMTHFPRLSRRTFVASVATLGGGLALGFRLSTGLSPARAASEADEVNAWVVEGGPRRDVAAQSQIQQIGALLLGHIDRVVQNAVRALEVGRHLAQENVEISLPVSVRHQDRELAL